MALRPRGIRGLRAVLAATAAVTVLVLGCGTDNSSSSSGSSSAEASTGFPVTIDSTLGAVEIPQRPQRVVTLGWGSTEAAIALGVIPVGMPDMKSDSGTADGIFTWVKDKLNGQQPVLLDTSTKSLPLEKIAELKPDVVLAVQSGLTADQYSQLSRIAPTVAYPGRSWQTSWEDQTTIVGKALGKSEEANKLVADAEKTIADVKAAHPEFSGKTIAAASATTTAGLNFYFDTDPRTKLLQAFGFTPLPSLGTLRETAPAGKFAAAVSWENVGQYNPDVLTSWYLDSATKASAESNPVFTGLGAVQRKSYVALTDPPLVYAVSSPNVLNLPWMLEQYVALLSTAAKAAG